MNQKFRSSCPITTTLDIVGDKWTLVILRDMVNGKSKFIEFLDSPEQITTNILTDRLSKMVSSGLAKKSIYNPRPKRYQYELTPRGRDLLPVVQEMCKWANKHLPDTWVPPASFMDKR